MGRLSPHCDLTYLHLLTPGCFSSILSLNAESKLTQLHTAAMSYSRGVNRLENTDLTVTKSKYSCVSVVLSWILNTFFLKKKKSRHALVSYLFFVVSQCFPWHPRNSHRNILVNIKTTLVL